jgi:hypothetical protein
MSNSNLRLTNGDQAHQYSDEMRTGIYLPIIVLLSAVVGIFLVNYLKQSNFVIPLPEENACSNDDECVWRITNCCPENAGAKWDCISVRLKENVSACPKSVICPQVLSPKPNQVCGCVNGMCEQK